MVFADLFFIYLFLPLCLISYLLAKKLKAKNIVLIIAGCAWGCLVLANIHRTVLFEDEIPLAAYKGNPPFATMADLAPGNRYEIRDDIQQRDIALCTTLSL